MVGLSSLWWLDVCQAYDRAPHLAHAIREYTPVEQMFRKCCAIHELEAPNRAWDALAPVDGEQVCRQLKSFQRVVESLVLDRLSLRAGDHREALISETSRTHGEKCFLCLRASTQPAASTWKFSRAVVEYRLKYSYTADVSNAGCVPRRAMCRLRRRPNSALIVQPQWLLDSSPPPTIRSWHTTN